MGRYVQGLRMTLLNLARNINTFHISQHKTQTGQQSTSEKLTQRVAARIMSRLKQQELQEQQEQQLSPLPTISAAGSIVAGQAAAEAVAVAVGGGPATTEAAPGDVGGAPTVTAQGSAAAGQSDIAPAGGGGADGVVVGAEPLHVPAPAAQDAAVISALMEKVQFYKREVANLQKKVRRLTGTIDVIASADESPTHRRPSSPTSVTDAPEADLGDGAEEEEVTEETKQEQVAELVLEAVKKAGVLTSKLHGKDTLSVSAGLLVQDLISNGNVPIEKLPIVVTDVVTMIFGVLPASALDVVVKASSTYTVSAERTMDLIKKDGARLFTDGEGNSHGVVHACLWCNNNTKKKCLSVYLWVDSGRRTWSNTLHRSSGGM